MNKKIIPIAALAIVIAISATATVSAHKYGHYGHHHWDHYAKYDNHYNGNYAGEDYYGQNADNNNSPDFSGDTKGTTDTAQKVVCEDEDSNCQATSTNVIGNGNVVIINTNGDGKQTEDYGRDY